MIVGREVIVYTSQRETRKNRIMEWALRDIVSGGGLNPQVEEEKVAGSCRTRETRSSYENGVRRAHGSINSECV